jgi:hypothetical protein
MSELADFLVAAKRSTYAGGGASAVAAPALCGTKQLEFERGPYFYRDIYSGFAFFAGHECVFREKQAVWLMSYSGGMTGEVAEVAAKDVYAFLRTALLRVSAEQPFRGPPAFADGIFDYENDVDGDIEKFFGVERVLRHGQVAYELRYSGGRC